ncbi:MAG: hypothetical protein HY898_19735 [Deltaproteobacteria bacterium]|nr:hypothetical protein [Deltaproteobacteria bacterium]
MSKASGGFAKLETIVPFNEPRADAPAVTAIRGILLVASLQALRDLDLFDSYIRLLPDEFHQPILTAVTSSDIPLPIAMAHYGACDRLGLAPSEIQKIGKRVGEKAIVKVLATLGTLARGAGVTPWTGLGAMARLWARLFEGGNVCVMKVGPKDARVVVEKVPLARIAYFRNSFLGVNEVCFAPFTRRVVINDQYSSKEPEVLGYLAAWV